MDAGANLSPEGLPVGRENPVILMNDGAYDNWQGEYAVLLAHTGGPALAGIVIGTGGMWSDVEANLGGWQTFVTRSRESGLVNVPDPIRSEGPPLARPDDGVIESTLPNRSGGALFIVETSSRLSQPGRPVVVATGGRLTDVADAYLVDSTVADRIVVVASLGTGFSDGERVARMGIPNGEMDPWANFIVATRLLYVQVSAYYDQTHDVPDHRTAELPDNPFGTWMRDKQPMIFDTPVASDQVSVLAVGRPAFAREVERVAASSSDGDETTLVPTAEGNGWLVTESDGDAATAHFWRLLDDPTTFGP